MDDRRRPTGCVGERRTLRRPHGEFALRRLSSHASCASRSRRAGVAKAHRFAHRRRAAHFHGRHKHFRRGHTRSLFMSSSSDDCVCDYYCEVGVREHLSPAEGSNSGAYISKSSADKSNIALLTTLFEPTVLLRIPTEDRPGAGM